MGAIILYAGAEWFVKGASSLSVILKVTPLMIGIAVVSAGTSAPELLVSMMAAMRGNSDISIGNVVGSNIANVALVLGFTSIIFPTTVNKAIIKRELAFMLGSSVIFFLLSMNGTIGRGEGILLLALIVFFISYSYKMARKEHAEASLEADIKEATLYGSLTWLILGCPALFLGSHLIITAGIDTARYFGISELTIGISLVAIGTSIPEMATSIMAAFRKKFDICVGNIVGSNIFNLLLVIGLVSLIHPLHVSDEVIHIHLPIMLLFSAALIPIMKTNFKISRLNGLLLLSAYAVYIGYIFKLI